MAKREEMRLDLTANDQASGKIDEVAAKLEGLNTAATVEVTAEDAATEVIEAVGEEVETLDGETAEVELAAEDAATEVVEEVTEAVETLDGETATPTLDADDQATGDIEGVSGVLADLDGESAAPLVEIEDEATSDIEDVSEALGDLDGMTATADVGVEGAEEAETATGGIGDNLSAIGAKGGLAALSATGMLAIGAAAGEAVLDVDALAKATGGSLEETSRLVEAWSLAGGNIDTLERNIIRANDRLRESPELARQLGVRIDENTSPMELFIEAVTALNSGQLTANERLDLAMDIFGSRGILMLNDLDSRVGDLGEAMAAVGDSEIITQEQVDAAIALNQGWDTVQDTMSNIARQVLPGIAGGVSNIAAILDSELTQKLLEVSERFRILETLVGLPAADTGSTGDLARSMIADRIAIEAASGAYEDIGMNMADVEGAAGDVAGALDEATEASTHATDALEDHKEAIQEDIEALEEQIGLLEEQAGGFRDAADAQLEVEEANRDAVDAQNAYNAALEEFGEGSREAQDALRGVRDAAINVADANVSLAQSQAAARGETLSEVQALDIMNSSLLGQAATLNGPARAAILQRIADVNAIPPNVMTAINSAIAAGDLAEAQRLLNEASAPRTVLMQAQIDWFAANNARAQLQLLTAPRSVLITPSIRAPVGQVRYSAGATGDPYTGSGLMLVGEEGPEIVDLPAGSRVTNAGQSAERMRNGGSGGVTNIYNTNNYPAGVRARDTAKALRRYERLQAS